MAVLSGLKRGIFGRFLGVKLKINFLSLSVSRKFLSGILKKIVFGLDGKNSFQSAEKVDFKFMPQKSPQKITLFGPLKMAIT
jgi:hypothetical protein